MYCSVMVTFDCGPGPGKVIQVGKLNAGNVPPTGSAVRFRSFTVPSLFNGMVAQVPVGTGGPTTYISFTDELSVHEIVFPVTVTEPSMLKLPVILAAGRALDRAMNNPGTSRNLTFMLVISSAIQL